MVVNVKKSVIVIIIIAIFMSLLFFKWQAVDIGKVQNDMLLVDKMVIDAGMLPYGGDEGGSFRRMRYVVTRKEDLEKIAACFGGEVDYKIDLSGSLFFLTGGEVATRNVKYIELFSKGKKSIEVIAFSDRIVIKKGFLIKVYNINVRLNQYIQSVLENLEGDEISKEG